MLSRSSFSIRRLISQRRPREDAAHDTTNSNYYDDERFSFDHRDEIAQLRGASRTEENLRVRAWSPARSTHSTSSKRSGRKEKEPVMIRRSNSLHRISGPLPPLPDGPPHSSASSLCSCDDKGDLERTASGKRKAALCLSEAKDGESASLRTPPRQGRPQSHHRRTTGMQSLSPSPSPRLRPESARPLSPRSPSRTPPPRPSRDAIDDNILEGISDNVQQLIRETDIAFRAVGSTLADGQVAADRFSFPERPRARSKTSPPRSSLQARAVLRKQQQQQQQKQEKPTIVITSPLGSPARSSSVTKSKRKKSKRGRRADAARKERLKAPSGNNPSRWTLSENVAEILTGQFFKRIEADEMLTPAQIAEFRASREQLERKSSEEFQVTESLEVESEDEGCETPVEPFHLEDLPSRVRAAGVKTTMSPIDVKPPPVSFDEIVRRDFSAPQRKKKRPAPLTELLPKTELAPLTEGTATDIDNVVPSEAALKALNIPSPPLKNPLRYLLRPQLPHLPTIPEVLVTAPQDDPAFQPRLGRKPTCRTFAPVEEDDFIFLKSSPYTLNMPTYRHGAIRFAKAEVCRREMSIKRDDTLDWTAFQMAILGGAGDDVFGECEDFARRRGAEAAEAAEADEIAGWFEDFGFEGYGQLVPEWMAAKEGKSAKEHSRRRSKQKAPSSKKADEQPQSCVSVPPPPSRPPPPQPEDSSSPSTAAYSPVSQSSTSSSTLSSSSGTTASDGEDELADVALPTKLSAHPSHADLPIPVAHEYPSGFWNATARAGTEVDPTRFYSAPGIKRWTVEGHPKRYNGGRESLESLPQSPMMPLVVKTTMVSESSVEVDADVDVEIVPMGYNLGHDLGDFLKWEAEHVYASAYVGSD